MRPGVSAPLLEAPPEAASDGPDMNAATKIVELQNMLTEAELADDEVRAQSHRVQGLDFTFLGWGLRFEI